MSSVFPKNIFICLKSINIAVINLQFLFQNYPSNLLGFCSFGETIHKLLVKFSGIYAAVIYTPQEIIEMFVTK